MSTTRIKDKVSELIGNHLPEFVRSDFTTFVAFLKLYYQFLEQDQGALELVQNARQYSDIDQTTESFVNFFLTNYAKDLPINLQANKPLLIKRIESLYTSKGSTLSIETLFKVLYDTTATTNHPYDFVLRPSDGKWNLRTSIRVELSSGSVDNITDRFLSLTKNNIAYTVEIVRVKNLVGNLHEIFFQSIVTVPFEINDTVFVSDNTNILFTGIVRPTTTAYEIRVGGSGFRTGQVFNVSVGGVETLVRVARVSDTGSIQLLKFINFGYNYTQDIIVVLTNTLGITTFAQYLDTKTGGFNETFSAIKKYTLSDPARYFDSDYVDIEYAGDSLVVSTTSSQFVALDTVGGSTNPNDAIISFTVGAVARYPGQYVSTQGFLSEPDVRMQDAKLYQPFAYQVSSELDISVFFDLVKKLVHQAGTNLFVNRILATSADLSADVEVVTSKNVFTQLSSVFNTLDINFYNLQKPLANVTSISDEFISLDVFKPLSDTAIITELINVVLFLEPFNDNVTLSDVSIFTADLVVEDAVSELELQNYTDGSYFAEIYALETIATGLTDDLQLIRGTTVVSDVSITESGSVFSPNYSEAGYFDELYAGTEVISFS